MTAEKGEIRRQKDREYRAAKRAAMTPEERAEARRAYDENYRNAHREQRREYDRGRALRHLLDPARRQARLSTEEKSNG